MRSETILTEDHRIVKHPPSRKNTLARALHPRFAGRSLMVALIVGTILNLINQWGAYLGDEPFDWLKLVLTYCVPFLVATYGTYAALRFADSSHDGE